MTISYVLDIGVYNLGTAGRVLQSTTAAWARTADGTDSLDGFGYSGGPNSGTLTQDGQSWECGRDIDLLAERISKDLAVGNVVALGFEAPMWFPVVHESTAPMQLFGPRFDAERGSEWYLQSGAAATMKALSLGTLLFSRLLALNSARLTTSPESAARQTIVLFEAFVVGAFKQELPAELNRVPNEWDALCASLAWGALHAARSVPSGLAARRLHSVGSNSKPVASVWSMLASTVAAFPQVEGPLDCEVIALGNDAPLPAAG